MVWKERANIQGPRGPEGKQGIPGTNVATTDAATAGLIDTNTPTQTKTALAEHLAPFGVSALKHMTEAEILDHQSGTPTLDVTAKIQAAITEVALAGGGVVRFPAGKFRVNGTLILLSHVTLRGANTHLEGSGTNTVLASGYLFAGIAVSNTGEWVDDSTGGGNGDPTHHTDHALVYGIKIDNCDTAMRLHWFTQGSSVENCDLDGATNSVRATNSWSQSYRRNTFRATVYLSHYVDWTMIENNSFESCHDVALRIGSGGSWTLGILRNGFHWTTTGEGIAIKFEGGARNVEIVGNHFESNWRHIYGGTNTLRAFTITNNHFAATPVNAEYTPVTAMEFLALRNSFIGYNDFELGGVTDAAFAAKLILNTDSTFYNRIILEAHPTTGLDDLAKCTIRSSNIIEAFAGQLASNTSQPSMTPMAGTSGYTVEKYQAKYQYVANQIPNCTITRTGATHVVDTHIDADASGVLQPAYFFIRVGGATNTYRVAGRIAGRFGSIVFDVRENSSTGAAGPTVVASHNAGKLRLTFSGLDDPSNISGWVKAI